MRGVVSSVAFLRRNVGRNVLTLCLRLGLRFAELEFASLEMTHPALLFQHMVRVEEKGSLHYAPAQRSPVTTQQRRTLAGWTKA